MATYYCGMKVGNKNKGASASAHFDYINREGNYNRKNEDLVATGSGNLPEFAKDDAKEFFRACDRHDIRTHRSITFTLPNELPREAQLEIVEEYCKIVAPNLPYSYAIHEVDSAVYGEKNPHCHLMFSERIVDERVEHLCEEDFFSKRGVARNGEEFGGSVKTRMYAGKSATKQIYEIREALAEITNRKYEEYGLDIRISADTLAKQENDMKKSGNVEVDLPAQPTFPRLSREMFHEYKNQIKEAVVHMEDVREKDLPKIVKDRILYEQERIITKDFRRELKQYNDEILKNKEAINYAISSIVRDRQIVQDVFYTPFKREDYFSHSINNVSVKSDKEVADVASLIVKDEVHDNEVKQLKAENELHHLLRDTKIALRKIEDEINYLSYMDEQKLYEMLLDRETDGLYTHTVSKISRKEALIEHYELVNKEKEADTNRKELLELYEEKERLSINIDKEMEETITWIEERLTQLECAKQNLEELLEKSLIIADYGEIETANQEDLTEQVVDKKHQKLEEKANEIAEKQVEVISEETKELTSDEKLKLKIRDKLLDEITDGEYTKLKEKLRSKESLIKYHRDTTKDMDKLNQTMHEAEYLKLQIRKIEAEHITPELNEKVEKEFKRAKDKQSRKVDKSKRKLEKVNRSKHVNQRVKNKASSVMNKLVDCAYDISSGKGNRQVPSGARSLYADRISAEEDIIR